VTVPRNRRRPVDAPDAELHWATLPAEDVREGVTLPVRTVTDCSRAYDRDVALAVADSALRSGRVTQRELLDAAELAPRTGRPAALWIARHATDNPFESVLRAIALDVPGLLVRPQGWVGGAGRADLVDERLLVAIEADSWAHHGAPDLFRRDVRRYTEFARLGWVVVRFVWEDVMYRQDVVRRHLAEVAAVRARQLGVVADCSR
jgi:very-short-patch-repair endonuclease